MDTRTRKPNRSDGAQGSGGDRKAVTGLLQVCASAPIERARLILRQAERILEARRKAAGEPKARDRKKRGGNDPPTTRIPPEWRALIAADMALFPAAWDQQAI